MINLTSKLGRKTPNKYPHTYLQLQIKLELKKFSLSHHPVKGNKMKNAQATGPVASVLLLPPISTYRGLQDDSWGMGSVISPGTSPVIGLGKFTLVEEGTDSLWEEFNLIYFLENAYKVITFKVNRKGKCFLSHLAVSLLKSAQGWPLFFHVSPRLLVLAYVAFLLSTLSLRKDTKEDSCLSPFILNLEMNV